MPPRPPFTATPPKEVHLLRPAKSPHICRSQAETYAHSPAPVQWRIHSRQSELLAEKGISITPEECMASFWQALSEYFVYLRSPTRRRSSSLQDVDLQQTLIWEAVAGKAQEKAALAKEGRSKKYTTFLTKYYPLVYYAREHFGLPLRAIVTLLADHYGFVLSPSTLVKYYRRAKPDFPDPPMPEGIEPPPDEPPPDDS